MASTSSTATPQWKFDVFLSFRGADTRDGFVSHLYEALCRKQIETFIDNRLEGGEDISPALLEKIEKSNISVVIFSKNYADSPWCLEELEKILECKETLGQMVLPVFYKVDPTHVQELSDSYGDALAQHQRKSRTEKVNRWRRALTVIANLKGWDSNNVKPETKLIGEIVDDVWNKLYAETSSDFHDLVGIDSRIKEVESLLCVGEPEVRIVGIWGMGGIGKTTLAEVIYDRISAQFEGQFFLPNIRQELEGSTLVALRNKILSEILGKDMMSIGTLSLPMPTKRMLRRKKVLIVLDDVSSPQQLKALVGEDGLLGQGSRVLVTSRDKQVLKNRCDQIYKVRELEDHEAVQLFRLHAFRQQICHIEEHMQLSRRMVEYANGIPLALKVLGSNLYDKDVEEWKSELAKLHATLDMEIQNILRISYDGLEPTEKSMFLDIACFFGTCIKDRVLEIFDRCGFFATRGLGRLNDKSLINISRNKIWMHDLLQKLGRDIVCLECINDPRKRSRLWIPDDIRHVLTHYKGSETIEAISLNMSEIRQLKLTRTVFEEMYNLRLLEFYGTRLFGENRILLPEGLEFISNKLRVLHWYQYPLKSLPSNFCPENLVELRMRGSHLINLSGFPRLEHLKLMDLSECENLIMIPDLSEVPNLTFLFLSGCESLVEVPPSIAYCSKLTKLDLGFCSNLRCLPSLLHLTSLKYLHLGGCAKIEEFPEVPLNIEELSLYGTAIKQVPSSIGHLSQLHNLNLVECKRLESVPSSIGQLKRLGKLSLRGCENLPDKQSEDLESPVGLHISVRNILSSLTSHLDYLHDLRLESCGISEIPHTLGSLVSLNILDLSRNHFKSMPASIKQLSNLMVLHLRQCQSLQCLPELPSRLKELDASHCSSLKSVHGTYPRVDVDEEEIESFKFAHCHCLDENACFQIMADLQLRIQRITTFMLNQEKKFSASIANLYIPGNEVPEWFSYKNTEGSSIQIIKPPHSYNNNRLLGGILCAVVVPKELQDFGHDWGKGGHFFVRCDCHFITESGCHNLHLDQEGFSGRIDKPHVFIWYRSALSSDHFFEEASFKFDIFWLTPALFGSLQVSKCGVLPLLTQDDGVDVDDGDGDGNGCGNNDDDDEIDEQPCSKRLKVRL